jgi:tetratricopeptide (TPR) repeat protein
MSTDTEWYRRTTWSAKDKEAFFAKLKGARLSSKKAQYVRIQALYLERGGTPELLRAALELLDLALSEFPHKTQRSITHLQRARCLEALGREDEALAEYRQSFEAERSFPNSRTEGYLDFGELVLGLQRAELYGEALACLEEFGGGELFPISQYRYFVILAFISEARGKTTAAQRYARQALDAAAQTESKLRSHRKLGLVGEQPPDIHARLVRIASGGR